MKKFFCILLSIFILLMAFTGCSSKKSENNNENKNDYQYKATIDFHYSEIDESVQRAYEKLTLGVAAYDSEVKFNLSMIDDITMLFYTCSPFNSLVEGIHILGDKSGVTIEYKNDINTHKQLVSDFNAKVNEIMTACDYNNVSINVFIINLYKYITDNFTIDNSVLNVVDCAINSKGANAVINSLFEYIILNAGGSAIHVTNYSGSAKMISMAKFNGSWYYFSPADEISSGSKALKYFAMNSGRIAKIASGNFNYTDQTPVDIEVDNNYYELDSAVSYTVEGKKLIITLSDNSTEEYDIQ